MELNLLPILNFDGRKIKILEDVELAASENDTFRFIAPIHLEGEAVNISGTIELTGKAVAQLEMVCDRCTESFEEKVEFELDEKLKKEDAFSDKEEDPDVIILSGTTVDLDELLYTNLYMNLPSKALCREDCKGLCPVCGKNLNTEECDCDDDNTDPRFDILDKLL